MFEHKEGGECRWIFRSLASQNPEDILYAGGIMMMGPN